MALEHCCYVTSYAIDNSNCTVCLALTYRNIALVRIHVDARLKASMICVGCGEEFRGEERRNLGSVSSMHVVPLCKGIKYWKRKQI